MILIGKTMNNIFLIFLLVSFLAPNKTRYWNLGISIKEKSSKRIIQKEISLNDIAVEQSNFYTQNETIYTLNKNYIIEPEEQQNIFDLDQESTPLNNDLNIKALIMNNEYFEVAKKLISFSDTDIEINFDSQNDYFYCSSLVYYNIGNINEAHSNINKISNKDGDVKILFLEALILNQIDTEQANIVLNKIISDFPSDDYSDYAKDILRENQ